MNRNIRRILGIVFVGVLLWGLSASGISADVEAPFNPKGKPLMYASYLPLVTDTGDIVPVLVEFYGTPAGEVVVEWNPFENRRLQAVDFSPEDPCGVIWINKALLTNHPQSGWMGWILRSKPVVRDNWELESSVSPQCRKSGERLTT